MIQPRSASSFLRRRLPVFFLVDVSQNMIGTFQVTMNEGLQKLTRELERHQRKVITPLMYLGMIRLAETGLLEYRGLNLPARLKLPRWQAEGRCTFIPALKEMDDAFTHSLIQKEGCDHFPLIFILLGSIVDEEWPLALKQFTDKHSQHHPPTIIMLVTEQRLVAEAIDVCDVLLLLKAKKAFHRFFSWALDVIVQTGENYYRGEVKLAFPELPDGIVAVKTTVDTQIRGIG